MRYLAYFALIFLFTSEASFAEKDFVPLSQHDNLNILLESKEFEGNFTSLAEYEKVSSMYVEGRTISEFFRERGIRYEQGSRILKNLAQGRANNQATYAEQANAQSNVDDLLMSYRAYEQSQNLTSGTNRLSNQMGTIHNLIGDVFGSIREASGNSSGIQALSEGFDLQSAGISGDIVEKVQTESNLSINDISALGTALNAGTANTLNNNKFLNGSSETTQRLLSQREFSEFIQNAQIRFNGVQQSIDQASRLSGYSREQAAGVIEGQLFSYASYLNSSLKKITYQLDAQGEDYNIRDLANGLLRKTGGEDAIKLIKFDDNNEFDIKPTSILNSISSDDFSYIYNATSPLGLLGFSGGTYLPAMINGGSLAFSASFGGGSSSSSTGGGKTKGFKAKENEATEIPGYYPLSREHNHCFPESTCDSGIPLAPTPGIKGKKGSEIGEAGVTSTDKSVSSMRRAALMQGLPVNNQEVTGMTIPKVKTGESVKPGDKQSFEIKGRGTGDKITFGKLFMENANRIAQKNFNWVEDPLERDEKSGAWGSSISGTAFDLEEEEIDVLKEDTGEHQLPYSNFNDEKQIVEAGFPLLLAKKDPRSGDRVYSVSPNKDWVPSFRPYEGHPKWNEIKNDPKNTKWKKWIVHEGGGGEYDVVLQKLNTMTDLFAPRGHVGWKERSILNTSPDCHGDTGDASNEKYDDDYGEKYNFSQVCIWGGETHTKKFPEYDNSSGVLATIPRQITYSAIFNTIYYACMAATFSGGDSVCCPIAREAACNSAILPHVNAKNDILYDYAYHETAEKENVPYATNDPVAFYNHETIGLPEDEYKGYESNGKTWVGMEPAERFKYKGPFLNNPITGELRTTAQIEKDIDRADLEPWRLTAIINPFILPDGSNIEEVGVFDMECKMGGFEAFKSHIAKCIDYGGINAVCDPNIATWKVTSIGRAMYMLGANSVSPGNNTNITREESADGLKRRDDKTYRFSFPFRRPHALAEKDPKTMGYWNATLNKERVLDDLGNFWPGEGEWLVKGFDKAEAKAILIDDNLSSAYVKKADSGRKDKYIKRPYVAFIQSKTPKEGPPQYLDVIRFNAGSSTSACGLTEMGGLPKKYRIYLSNDADVSFTEGGDGALKPCIYSEYKNCYYPEEDRNNVKIYIPRLDKRGANPDNNRGK